MKGIFGVYILALVLALGYAKCPSSELIYPCHCTDPLFHGFSSIQCVGSSVTDEFITKTMANAFKEKSHDNTFGFLVIHDTALTALAKDAFGMAVFHSITIENNEKLAHIDAAAFSASDNATETLIVRDNPMMTSDNLFALARAMTVVVIVDFRRSHIKEIPANAFAKMTHLRTIHLEHNQISKVDDNGLTFDRHSERLFSILVQLSYNDLNEKSFAKNSLENKEKNTHVILHIDGNKFTSLPEDPFKSFLSEERFNFLVAEGNEFKCDCSMKWILNIHHTRQPHMINVMCANHEHKEIHRLRVEDLGNCS